jgi:hypothetical protein
MSSGQLPEGNDQHASRGIDPTDEGASSSRHPRLRAVIHDRVVLTAMITLAGTLIAGLMALGGVLVGSWMAGKYAIEGQKAQLIEERTKLAKEKRTLVYGQYLSDTRQLWQAISSPSAKVDSRSGAPFILPPHSDFMRPDLATPYNRYVESYDEVAIYGTDESWSAVKKIDSIIERYVRRDSRARVQLPDAATQAEWKEAMSDYRKIMCRELSHTPRPGCKTK